MINACLRRAAFLVMACVALAAGAAELEAAQVDELIRKSGLWEEAASARDQIKAGARESWKQESSSGNPAMSAADVARFEAAADKAFAPEAMRRSIALDMRKLLSKEDAEAVLAWLTSELGARLTQLEEQASRAEEAMRTLPAAREAVAALAPERKRRLERLLDAVGADEHNFEVAANMSSAMVFAMSAMQPQGDPEGAAEAVRKKLEAQRAPMTAYYHQMALASAAGAYRDVSDADLDRYIEFNRTPAAKRFNDASIQGFQRALVQGCLELGRFLGKEAQRRPIVS